MAKSKHRLGNGKKSKRSSTKGANTKLASKKSEATKPRNKAVTALLSTASFIRSKTLNIFAAFKAMAKGAKEVGKKAAVPVKAAAISVKTKHIKAVSTVKAVAAAINDKRLKAVAAMKAASASVKKWLPIAGVTFWNYIIAPVLAVVIVMRSRPRYMAAALLLIAIPAAVITMIAFSFPSTESGDAVPAILAADNKASDAAKTAEAGAAIQDEPLDSENETGLNVTALACAAVIIILTALALWVVIPRKSDPMVPLEGTRNEDN